MNWTDERVELLRKLWGEGLSASQIASQLGSISRNAVVGKVHRLKLSGRGRKWSQKPGRKPKPKPIETAKPEKLPVMEPPPIAMEIVERPIYRYEAEGNFPISRRLSLTELTDRTCKWPSGDPLTEEFSFCGNGAGDAGPYCGFHSRLAYVPRSERVTIR